MSKFQALLLERCARAAVAAAIGVVSMSLASGGELTVTRLQTIGIAAGAAAVSAVLSIISQLVGDPESTSFTKTTVSR